MMGELKLYVTQNTWNFPRTVAKEQGYFEEEGLDVELVERPFRETEDEDIYIRKNIDLFEDEEVDVYSACVWGTIKRTWDSDRGEIVAHNAVSENLPYTIFTRPETAIHEPADLANVTVGIKNHSGSHYSTIEELETVLDEEGISVEHVGRPINRLWALIEDEVRAATLVGPVAQIASNLGMQVVSEFSHGGAFIAPKTVTDREVDALVAAINRAIEDINENPEAFRDYFVEMAKNELAAVPELEERVDVDAVLDELVVPYYDEKVRRADREDLERKIEWMQRYDLLSNSVTLQDVTTA